MGLDKIEKNNNIIKNNPVDNSPEKNKVFGKKKGGNPSLLKRIGKLFIGTIIASGAGVLAGSIVGAGAGAAFALATGGIGLEAVPIGAGIGAVAGGIIGAVAYLFDQIVVKKVFHKKNGNDVVPGIKDTYQAGKMQLHPKDAAQISLCDRDCKYIGNLPQSKEGIEYNYQAVRDFGSGSRWIINNQEVDISKNAQGGKANLGDTGEKQNAQIHHMDKHIYKGCKLNQQQITNLLSITQQGTLSTHVEYLSKGGENHLFFDAIKDRPNLRTEYYIDTSKEGIVKIDIFACYVGKDPTADMEGDDDSKTIRQICYVRKSITISNDDLDTDWTEYEDHSQVAPSLESLDYYTPIYIVPPPYKEKDITKIAMQAKNLIHQKVN